MAYENTLACAPHAMLVIVLFKPPQAIWNRSVLLWLGLFSTKGVVAERIEAYRFGLVG